MVESNNKLLLICIFAGGCVVMGSYLTYKLTRPTPKPKKRRSKKVESSDEESLESEPSIEVKPKHGGLKQQDDDFPEYPEEVLIEDLHLLGDITVNPQTGLLHFSDFCRLFLVIKKHQDPKL
jgi:hypothetical protein